ncbi:MAG: hypothetical protein QOG52_237 [Frankiaceae bacterium]|nr:hypothetical protein [Frankiaceae bacterium]
MPVTQLEPATTALVLIDLQRSVVAMPVEPHSAASVVANSVALADAFREAGGLVVLVHVFTSPDGGDALRSLVDRPRPASVPAPGAAEIVPELRPDDRAIVVRKRNWGAFYGTDLDLQLRRRGVRTVVLGGIATTMGVESTARSAHEHGYHVVLVEDAMSGLVAAEHAFSVEHVFPRIGRVTSTAEVLAALRTGR